MHPGELFSQMRIKCGGISENSPHAAKYRIADLKETSDFTIPATFKNCDNLSHAMAPKWYECIGVITFRPRHFSLTK